MNWTTIYITGKTDFREDVKRKLNHADLQFMPGYIDNSSTSTIHDLYWLDEKADLHRFKAAIGSKLIWKYRLRFFDSLEKFVESQNHRTNADPFTREELSLIAEIQGIVKHQVH
jgi:hypothetical protein